MAENTQIEWAHHSYSLWWGCTEVSPGCDHCYARSIAKRFHPDLNLWGEGSSRLSILNSDGKRRAMNMPYTWNNRAAKAGERHRVFVQSMGDVFDNHGKGALDEERAFLWTMIRKTPHLDWLLLTKRIGNAAKMLPSDWGAGYENVWLGATVVSQDEADRDIPKLLSIPARVRFLSCEPLLSDIDLTGFIWGRQQPCPECPQDVDCDCGGVPTLELPDEPAISWLIVGGESGPKARPPHPEWIRSLRDQCVAASVPIFFKQWGTWEISSTANGHHDCCMTTNGAMWVHSDGLVNGPAAVRDDGRGDTDPYAMIRVGKKKSGRVLDGRTWDEFPR